MSSFIGQFFQLEDVRSTDNHLTIPAGTYKFSTDFEKFPGFSNINFLEKLVLDNVGPIMRATIEKWHYSIYISIGYVIVTFTLQALMSRLEKPFDLKRELIIWNWLLAIFSFLGCVRCLPEFYHIVRHRGFTQSYINNSYVEDIRISSWYLFFTLSKAPELIDTMFIVLRKRRLIKLHWIHHTLTLIYSWFVFGDMPSTARWMVNMNLVVHTMMYSYYALSAMRIRIPRQINVTITTLQILQMFAGLYINIDCLRRKLTNQQCDLSLAVVLSGFTLYFLFFILFVNFFIRAYVIPSSSKAMKVAMANGKSLLQDLNNNAQNGKEVVKKLQ